MQESHLFTACLHRLSGVGHKTLAELWRQYNWDMKQAWTQGPVFWSVPENVKKTAQEWWEKAQETDEVGTVQKILSQADVSVFLFPDGGYPEPLRHIALAPFILYCRGTLPRSWSSALSVVGSRNKTQYGQQALQFLLGGVSDQISDLILVSGGALGVDSAVHSFALERGVATAVVFGTGIDRAYPAGNRDLYHKIVQSGGVLISDFPLGTAASPGNFPARNRIVAGLSEVLLVLEAGEDSGSLITAQCALDYGKNVCVVPNSIFAESSFGCLSLLKRGMAKAVYHPSHILEEFSTWIQSDTTTQQIQMFAPASVTLETVSGDIDALRVCQLLVWRDGVSLDDLSVQLTLPPQTVSMLVSLLEMDTIIQQDINGLWRLNSQYNSVDTM